MASRPAGSLRSWPASPGASRDGEGSPSAARISGGNAGDEIVSPEPGGSGLDLDVHAGAEVQLHEGVEGGLRGL